MKIFSVALFSQAKQSECVTVHFFGLDSYRTLYNTPQQSLTIGLSTKPLQKLTGTGRQADAQDQVLSEADSLTKKLGLSYG